MTPLASVIALGFLLGMRHATDVDHVVAVAAIVSRERTVRFAALIGALWGLGHTLTIVLVGAPIVVFSWAVAPRIGLAMEFGVALMLVLLGLRNLAGWRADTAQPHDHGPAARRTDDRAAGALDRRLGTLGFYQAARPIGVGVVHGLAGSAAVALLVLTTIGDPVWGVAYLLVFGAGTVCGMMLVTTAIALPFAGPREYSPSAHRRIRTATGLLSFGFGLFLTYRIGIVEGLFLAASRLPQ